MILKDTDKMPFGIHKDKRMIDVPAKYLLWLYENDKCNKDVRDYVIYNLDVLKKQAK